MSEYSIYKQFSKPELVQRCLDLGVNRVGLLADNKRLRSEVEEKHRLNMEYANEVLRLRAELAEVRPDCRTCQHFYSDFDLGEAQCGFNNTGVGILCVAGDRHEPFDPVRLYAIDAAMAGGKQ